MQGVVNSQDDARQGLIDGDDYTAQTLLREIPSRLPSATRKNRRRGGRRSVARSTRGSTVTGLSATQRRQRRRRRNARTKHRLTTTRCPTRCRSIFASRACNRIKYYHKLHCTRRRRRGRPSPRSPWKSELKCRDATSDLDARLCVGAQLGIPFRCRQGIFRARLIMSHIPHNGGAIFSP